MPDWVLPPRPTLFIKRKVLSNVLVYLKLYINMILYHLIDMIFQINDWTFFIAYVVTCASVNRLSVAFWIAIAIRAEYEYGGLTILNISIFGLLNHEGTIEPTSFPPGKAPWNKPPLDCAEYQDFQKWLANGYITIIWHVCSFKNQKVGKFYIKKSEFPFKLESIDRSWKVFIAVVKLSSFLIFQLYLMPIVQNLFWMIEF